MAVVTMRQLLEAGVHFGHQTRRWNPKMKRFLYGERNGIYIIDLQKTVGYLDVTYPFLRDAVAKGGTVLFVGTKKQAQDSIQEQAERVGMPYVNYRWLGGMLTNFTTIHRRLQRLKELEGSFADGSIDALPKREVQVLRKELDKLQRNLGGMRDMTRVPSAIWVVDTRKEHIAVTEARKLGIPVVAILDSNCDPDEVDFPIPGNDDAIRAAGILTRVVADAVAEGLRMRSSVAGGGTGSKDSSAAAEGKGPAQPGTSAVDEEPLAQWEQDILTQKDGQKDGQKDATAAPSGAQPSSEQTAKPATASSSQDAASDGAAPSGAGSSTPASVDAGGTQAAEPTPAVATPQTDEA